MDFSSSQPTLPSHPPHPQEAEITKLREAVERLEKHQAELDNRAAMQANIDELLLEEDLKLLEAKDYRRVRDLEKKIAKERDEETLRQMKEQLNHEIASNAAKHALERSKKKAELARRLKQRKRDQRDAIEAKLRDANDSLIAKEQQLEYQAEMEILQLMAGEGEIPEHMIGEAINSALTPRHQKQQTELMARQFKRRTQKLQDVLSDLIAEKQGERKVLQKNLAGKPAAEQMKALQQMEDKYTEEIERAKETVLTKMKVIEAAEQFQMKENQFDELSSAFVDLASEEVLKDFLEQKASKREEDKQQFRDAMLAEKELRLQAIRDKTANAIKDLKNQNGAAMRSISNDYTDDMAKLNSAGNAKMSLRQKRLAEQAERQAQRLLKEEERAHRTRKRQNDAQLPESRKRMILEKCKKNLDRMQRALEGTRRRQMRSMEEQLKARRDRQRRFAQDDLLRQLEDQEHIAQQQMKEVEESTTAAINEHAMATDRLADQIKGKAAIRKRLGMTTFSKLKMWAAKSKKAAISHMQEAAKKMNPKKRRAEREKRKAEKLKAQQADTELTPEQKEADEKELAKHRKELVAKGVTHNNELDKLLSQRKVTIQKRRKREQRRKARKARGGRERRTKRGPAFKRTFGWTIPEQIIEELLDQKPLLKRLQNIEEALSGYMEAQKSKEQEKSGVVDLLDIATPLEGELVVIPDTELDKGLAARLQLARSLATRLGFDVEGLKLSGSSKAGPLAIRCAAKLPLNDYEGNRFRNSIHFDDNKRVLYIRPQRLNTVGELVVVIAHSLSHVLARDMGNDNTSLFQARFFAALKVFAKHMRSEGRTQALATASRDPQAETKQYSPSGLDARVQAYKSAVHSIPLVTPIPENYKEIALKRAFDREDAAKQAWAADTAAIKVLQNNVRRLRIAIEHAEEDHDTFTAMVMTGQLDIETARLEAATTSRNVYNLTFGVAKTSLDVITTPRVITKPREWKNLARLAKISKSMRQLVP